mgnify:CR=1 FL=1
MIRNFILYGALCLIIQGLVACGPAGDTGTAEKTASSGRAGEKEQGPDIARIDGGIEIIAFGDSLYAGYGLPPGNGFAPQLQAALRMKGVSVNVTNAGVSGDTTAAGRARLSFLLDNLQHPVDLVILGLGGNDMLRGISPEQTRENLTAMMDELQRRDIDVILTGMLAAPNLGAEYGAAFNPIYSDLARDYAVPLYPFFLQDVLGDDGLMLSDNIHPNGAGVARIVGGMLPVVSDALKDKEKS